MHDHGRNRRSLEARNLKRLAGRAWLGLATAPRVRIHANDQALTRQVEVLTNDAISTLFLAVMEASEEAVYNSMFRATTMTGHGHTVESLPLEKTTQILRKYGAIT